MRDQATKAEDFQALHRQEGAFVVPNPWDVGTAKLLASLGFRALATTSSGLANSLGQVRASLDQVIDNCRAIVAATDLPVTADLENGWTDDPRRAAEAQRRAFEAGAVAGSIEDATGNRAKPIYDFALAVERVHAAVEVARSLPIPWVLTARADGLLHGYKDLDDALRRLQAFGEAGADVLYVPGVHDLETIRTVCSSLSKPVNVVMGFADTSITLDQLSAAGVRRVSIGGAMSQYALAAFLEAAREMAAGGFTFVRRMAPRAELKGVFRK